MIQPVALTTGVPNPVPIQPQNEPQETGFYHSFQDALKKAEGRPAERDSPERSGKAEKGRSEEGPSTRRREGPGEEKVAAKKEAPQKTRTEASEKVEGRREERSEEEGADAVSADLSQKLSRETRRVTPKRDVGGKSGPREKHNRLGDLESNRVPLEQGHREANAEEVVARTELSPRKGAEIAEIAESPTVPKGRGESPGSIVSASSLNEVSDKGKSRRSDANETPKRASDAKGIKFSELVEGSGEKKRPVESTPDPRPVSDKANHAGEAVRVEVVHSNRKTRDRSSQEPRVVDSAKGSEPKSSSPFVAAGSTEAFDKPGSTKALVVADAAQKALLARNLRESTNMTIVRQARLTIHDGENGEIKLTLKPEELGRVRIQLSMNDNHIAGRIIVENSSIRDVFLQNLQSLQEAFSDEGLDAGAIEVSVDGEEQGEADRHADGNEKRQIKQLAEAVLDAAPVIQELSVVNIVV